VGSDIPDPSSIAVEEDRCPTMGSGPSERGHVGVHGMLNQWVDELQWFTGGEDVCLRKGVRGRLSAHGVDLGEARDLP